MALVLEESALLPVEASRVKSVAGAPMIGSRASRCISLGCSKQRLRLELSISSAEEGYGFPVSAPKGCGN